MRGVRRVLRVSIPGRHTPCPSDPRGSLDAREHPPSDAGGPRDSCVTTGQRPDADQMTVMVPIEGQGDREGGPRPGVQLVSFDFDAFYREQSGRVLAVVTALTGNR